MFFHEGSKNNQIVSLREVRLKVTELDKMQQYFMNWQPQWTKKLLIF